MSEPTPRDNDETPIEPAAPVAAAPVAVAPAPAVRSRWHGRRVPLLVSGAALILGCLLGGAVVAIAAFAVDGNHGDDRGSHNSRDERADGRGTDDSGGNSRHQQNRKGDGRTNDDQSTPAPSTSARSAPAASAPTPSASA